MATTPECEKLGEAIGNLYPDGAEPGTFTVKKAKVRKGVNPRIGEAIKVKAAVPSSFRPL